MARRYHPRGSRDAIGATNLGKGVRHAWLYLTLKTVVNFDFKRPTRQCCVTDQPIRPGEEYYTALRELQNGQLERSDWSAVSWSGPPADCIAWWKSRVPTLDQGRVYWAPNDILRAVFQYYMEQPEQHDTAYVMALLLLRKRLLQWRETVERDGLRWLVLYDPKNQATVEVREVVLTPDRANAIQHELAEKLFTSHSSDEVEGDSHVIA